MSVLCLGEASSSWTQMKTCSEGFPGNTGKKHPKRSLSSSSTQPAERKQEKAAGERSRSIILERILLPALPSELHAPFPSTPGRFIRCGSPQGESGDEQSSGESLQQHRNSREPCLTQLGEP